MKQSEFGPCAFCGSGMAKTGVHFYRVTVEQMILNPRAIQRQHGLEMMLGSPALAAALGTDADLATGLGPKSVLICGQCGVAEPRPIHAVLETAP